MSINIKVDGEIYENFTSARVKISLDSVSGSFSFAAVSSGGVQLPFDVGAACEILVNDETVLNGYIEKLEVSYSANGHKILLSGRDKTADLIDSTIQGINLSPPISLKQAIQATLDDIGNTSISITEDAETDDFNKAEEKINGSQGRNAFEFVEHLARKRQVLLTRDGNGGIEITKGSGVDSGAKVQNIIGSNDNNIKSGAVSYDLTGRFNKYVIASQLSPVALNFGGETTTKEVVEQCKHEIDSEIREGRQLVIKAETASSNAQCEKRAVWSSNIRKARGRIYSCIVQGFNNSEGDLYKPNHLIQVADEFANINAKMLLNSIEFSFDVSEGSISSLAFVDSNAYTLELTQPKTEKIGAAAAPTFDTSRLRK